MVSQLPNEANKGLQYRLLTYSNDPPWIRIRGGILLSEL